MTSIKELTKKLGIPYHFLAKILQSLTRKGLLVSLKGPTGGFALSMPAKNITLFHVVEAIDGVDFTNRCVLGFPDCSGKSPCAVHDKWSKVRDEVYSMLVRKNVLEIAYDMRKPGYRISSE